MRYRREWGKKLIYKVQARTKNFILGHKLHQEI